MSQPVPVEALTPQQAEEELARLADAIREALAAARPEGEGKPNDYHF